MVAIFSCRVGNMNLWGPKEKKIRSDPFQSVVSGARSLRDLRITVCFCEAIRSINSCCFYCVFKLDFLSWALVEFSPSCLQLVRCSNTCIGPCVWSLEHIVELLHSATLNATFVQAPKPNTTNFNNFGFVSDLFIGFFCLSQTQWIRFCFWGRHWLLCPQDLKFLVHLPLDDIAGKAER